MRKLVTIIDKTGIDVRDRYEKITHFSVARGFLLSDQQVWEIYSSFMSEAVGELMEAVDDE